MPSRSLLLVLAHVAFIGAGVSIAAINFEPEQMLAAFEALP